MTAEEFKAKREKLFGTQGRAAEALGVNVATIKNYEKGRRKVPELVVKLIKCLEREK